MPMSPRAAAPSRGVYDGVEQYVPIAVSGQPLAVGNGDSPQNKRALGNKAVSVIAYTGPQACTSCRCFKRAWTIAASSLVVTFMLE